MCGLLCLASFTCMPAQSLQLCLTLGLWEANLISERHSSMVEKSGLEGEAN